MTRRQRVIKRILISTLCAGTNFKALLNPWQNLSHKGLSINVALKTLTLTFWLEKMTQNILTATPMQNEANENKQLDTALSTDIVVLILCKYTRLSSSWLQILPFCSKHTNKSWRFYASSTAASISIQFHFGNTCPLLKLLFSSPCATSRDWVVFRMPPSTPAVCAPIHFLLQSPAPPGPLSAPVDFLSRTWARSFLIVFNLKEIKIRNLTVEPADQRKFVKLSPNTDDNPGIV